MTDFVSRLGPAMSDFLDYKNALGIKYTSASVYLRELDRYNASHGDHSTLAKVVVDGWAIEHAGKSTRYHRSVNSADTLSIPEIPMPMFWIIHLSSNAIIRKST